MDIGHILDKSARRGFPGVLGSKIDTGLRRNFQRRKTCRAQILIQNSDRRCADDIARSGDRKCRNRHAACQRFQENEAESVGLARKYENVGGGIDLRQGFALQRTEEQALRILLLQRGARRSVADDHLGAGEIEIEKRFEILLNRNAADTQEHRRRQAEIDAARMEEPGVDAAGPSTTFSNPRIRNSFASAGVAAITARLGAWKRRSARQISDSGIGARARTYSGKRVWKLVVKGKRCLRQ